MSPRAPSPSAEPTRAGTGTVAVSQVPGADALLFVPRGLPDPDVPAWAALASTVLGDLVEQACGLVVAIFERPSERRRAGLVLRGLTEAVQDLEASDALTLPSDGVVLVDRQVAADHPALLSSARCLVVSRLALPWPRPPWTPAPTDEDPGHFLRYDLPLGVTAFHGLVTPFLAGSAADSRLLAILDPRLVDRPYGRWFLNVLPPLRRSRDLEDAVACFHRGTP